MTLFDRSGDALQVDRVSMLAGEVTSSFLATDSSIAFQDTHSATDTSCAPAQLRYWMSPMHVAAPLLFRFSRLLAPRREHSQHSACDLARISGDTAASIEQVCRRSQMAAECREVPRTCDVVPLAAECADAPAMGAGFLA